MTVFEEIIAAHKRGEHKGIPSICSAHPAVISAALAHACAHHTPLLIESTCNQVNQEGGYTGMTPMDFSRFLRRLAEQFAFPQQDLLLGGDHLGPEVWRSEPAESAMAKARLLVCAYVRAGYQKIHLDASMKLGDDPLGPLAMSTAAERAADLAQVAEDAYIQRGDGEAPRYVIGTEVPVPGGARVENVHLRPTRVADAEANLQITRQAFHDRGLQAAWDRVIALVVQPGVEFGHDLIHDYDPAAASALSRFLQGRSLVYEAHSTDYQTAAALRQLVADHFAILKVGPALTFAYREAVFALAIMESALFSQEDRSNLVEVLDKVMLADPTYWRNYYGGDPAQQRFARLYSFSDRCRYYWTYPSLQAALRRLLQNLRDHPPPLSLISQHFPHQYALIRQGRLEKDPEAIIQNKITTVLDDYRQATAERKVDEPRDPS